MKVLVTGAGGFLGQAVVRALSDRGHEAIGLVRRPGQRSTVVAAGGTPVLGDVLVPPSLARASAGCAAAIHLAATHADDPGSTALVERVRVEGAHNLVRSARAQRVRRLVIGSGYWVYRGSASVITESSPLDPRGESRNNFEAERAGLAANAPGALDVLVVRPGMVYGDGAWFGTLREAIDAGAYRVIEEGMNRWSFVALPDTGAAFTRVVEEGLAGEVYNVTDGRPVSWREFVGFVAERLGRPAPGRMSIDDAVRTYGADVAHHLAADRAVSSAKLKGLGWTPRFPTYRDGVAELLAEIEQRIRREAGPRDRREGE